MDRPGGSGGGGIQPANSHAPGGRTSGAFEQEAVWQAGSGEIEGELHYYWRILYGRRWFLLASGLLGFAVAAFMTFRQPRLYQAQATVEFKQVLPPGKDMDIGRRELYVPAELARRLLTTKLLAARVINAERARGDDWFQAGAEPEAGKSILGAVTGTIRGALSGLAAMARRFLAPPPPSDAVKGAGDAEEPRQWEGVDLGVIRRYYSQVSVRPVRRTSLVDIVATHTVPRVAAALANDHAQGFVDLDVETKIASLSEAQGLFGRQLEEVRGKIEASRKALTDYQLEHGIVGLPQDSTTLTRQSLQQLNELLTQAEAERIAAEATYRNAAAMPVAKLTSTLPDAGLQVIRDEVLKLQARYQANLQDYGENHPSMISLRARIAASQGRLREAALQSRGRLHAAYEAARGKERQLRSKLETLSRAASAEDRGLVQLLVLQRDVSGNEELYAGLLEKAKQADLLHGSAEWTNVSLVDRAVAPTVPSYPRTRRSLMFGLLLGLALGMAFSLGVERLDTTVHTPDQLAGVLGIPTVGVVPDFRQLASGAGYGRYGSYGRHSSKSEEAEDVGRELVTLAHPASVVSEAYRSIRTNLLFSSPGGAPRTVLITSSQPGEGKTVTTVNLAITLALSGSKVLVVDADLRKPGCHEMLRIDREPGLSNVLSGQCEIDDAVRRSPLSPKVPHLNNGHGVYVMPSGRVPPNPAELLSSGVMSELLATVGEQFGFVLIDSPPLLPVTDSVAVSTIADAVLMVVREGEWGRDVLRKAHALLQGVHAHTLGTILNCVNISRGGSSYYYYRHYYGYGAYYHRSSSDREASRDNGAV